MDEGHREHRADDPLSPSNDAPNNATAAPSTSTPDATTRLLHFLAHASTEQLCSIAIGLIACTYIILGRVGLVLIGIIGGIVLHATWVTQGAVADVQTAHQAQKGLDILQRVLDWRERQSAKPYDVDEDDDTDEKLFPGHTFEDFRPATAAALTDFVEATIRDYVEYWYLPILPEEKSFPQTSRQTLVSFLRSISKALSRKRPADAFLDFFTNCSSIVIVFFGELSSAILASPDSDISPLEVVEEYLDSNPNSNLAHIMDEKQQHKKFQLIANDLLHNFIEKSVYNCSPARTFLERILGGVVMETSLKACSKPEWLNGWIVYLLEEGEPDLIQAIDAGMGISAREENAPNTMNQPATTEFHSPIASSLMRSSRAEEAMKAAVEEAERLNQLIAEDDSRRAEGNPTPSQPRFPQSVSDTSRISQSQAQLNDGGGTLGPTTSPVADGANTEEKSQFTSFDQIMPQKNSDSDIETPKQPSILTLQDVGITILDDSSPSDNGRFRSKPTGDYLVQIEPRSSRHPGWMIVRKYADFETLHEVLKRIAQVSGVVSFTQKHGTLPPWKNQVKANLRIDLENYLRDACRHTPLAESVGMKRFLEKEQSQSHGQPEKGFQGIGWPSPAAFETMGKGLVDNLMSASKGAAEGSKSVFGGMTGVLGNISSGRNRSDSKISLGSRPSFRSSVSLLPEFDDKAPVNNIKPSSDAVRNEVSVSGNESTANTVSHGPEQSYVSGTPVEDISNKVFVPSMRSSVESLGRDGENTSPMPDLDNIVLPPPPSDIPDDYGSVRAVPSPTLSKNDIMTPMTSTSNTSPVRSLRSASISEAKVLNHRKEPMPFTEEETRVALELTFAMINELYTLSSVWNIRRTLLTAAKTFLLRPGNPSLTSIQSLIQENVIASNTSDDGIASHLRKLRENTMPTEKELKGWPKELSSEEKAKLRLRARKLVIERGIPPALAGVMGQAATSEAVGRVFDCLQDEKVARGLMFGLLLQGIRTITN